MKSSFQLSGRSGYVRFGSVVENLFPNYWGGKKRTNGSAAERRAAVLRHVALAQRSFHDSRPAAALLLLAELFINSVSLSRPAQKDFGGIILAENLLKHNDGKHESLRKERIYAKNV